MLNRLFRKPNRASLEEATVCCESCQRFTERATEIHQGLERRLAEVEANLVSTGSVELLKLRIDFALRLLAHATPQRRGNAEPELPAEDFQAERIEAMFDLAGRLIKRMEQVAAPNDKENAGQQSPIEPNALDTGW